jgi:hypothetical protein
MTRNEEQTQRVIALAQTAREALLSDVSNPIEGLFETPIPERLWHYTTIEGLDGILSSGRIWATEARATTDKQSSITRAR